MITLYYSTCLADCIRSDDEVSSFSLKCVCLLNWFVGKDETPRSVGF